MCQADINVVLRHVGDLLGPDKHVLLRRRGAALDLEMHVLHVLLVVLLLAHLLLHHLVLARDLDALLHLSAAVWRLAVALIGVLDPSYDKLARS